jgi:hypothetical protein
MRASAVPDEFFLLLVAGFLIFGGVLHLFFPRQVLETNKRFRSGTGIEGFESLPGFPEGRIVRLLGISGCIAITIGAALLCASIAIAVRRHSGTIAVRGYSSSRSAGFPSTPEFRAKDSHVGVGGTAN